jgi:adenine/guanine phosphoribosyltransferase-like PRPP-binding protein
MNIANEPAVVAASLALLVATGLGVSLVAMRRRRGSFDSDENYREMRNQAVTGLIASGLLLSAAVAILLGG